MSACESRLAAVSSEPGGRLGESCLDTLEAGGKRLRPLLVLMSARQGSAIGAGHIAAAAAVELVHMATLVHDDVLDNAELRRGRQTMMARYGPEVSAAAGDYLFASAFEILSGAGSPPAVALLAQTSLGLSRGELLQMEQTGDLHLTFDAYDERCRLKTAGLFSAACMLGAMLSGCTANTVAALEEFGNRLGLAFQLADDILDFSDEDSLMGKRAGADLRDGTVTLPLMMAIERDVSLRESIAGGLSEDEIAGICERVRSGGALEAAGLQAREHADRAVEALAEVAHEVETGPLALIAAMSVERKA